MGNFVNGCVILTVMAIYNLTGPTLDPIGSRNTIMIQFAVGAAVATFMVLYRFFRLKESKVGGRTAPLPAARQQAGVACCNTCLLDSHGTPCAQWHCGMMSCCHETSQPGGADAVGHICC